MGMELKLRSGITVGHGFHVLIRVEGIENAQRIRQQISQDALVFECVHHVPDIVATVAHSLRPILEIEVHIHALGMGISDHIFYISDMLLRRFLQLVLAVAEGSFGQQVDGLTTTLCDPVDGFCSINKSQDLYPIEHIMLTGIVAYHSDCILLAF